MRMRAIMIEGDADPATLAAIRAVLELSPGPVHVIATAGVPPLPTVGAVVKRVAFETGVSEATMLGPYRGKGAVRARTMAMWAARELLGAPLERIARRLGNRDHTTISAGVTRARRLLESDPAFALLAGKMRDYVAAGSREARP